MQHDQEKLKQTVLRAAGGDHAAFEELVALFNSRLKYYAGRFIADDDARDDLVQQVWITAYLSLGKLRAPEAFVVWLYRIAHNHIRTAQRQQRRFLFWLPMLASETKVEAPDASDEEISMEEAKWVHEGLARLSSEHREVLVLRFMEELDYDEIAKVVGVNPGTIKSRLHYAKKALREIIEQAKRNE